MSRACRRSRGALACLAIAIAGACAPAASPAARPAAGGHRLVADFADAADLAAWSASGVTASLQAGSGGKAARLEFLPARSASYSLRLTGEAGDWSGWRRLSLRLGTAGGDSIALKVQLRDRRGRNYTERVHLAARSSRSIALRLDRAAASLDLARVAMLRIYRWRGEAAATVWLERIALEQNRPVEPPLAEAAFRPGERLTAWVVPALYKVFPDGSGVAPPPRREVDLSLARGETEPFQIVLVGARDRSTRLRLRLHPLAQAGGDASLAAACLEARRVGQVRTTAPDYEVRRVGDWPDPLLPAREVEVGAGAIEVLWVSLSAPPAQPAGTYRGTIELDAGEGQSQRVPVTARVRDFTLPRVPTLKTAFHLSRGKLRRAYPAFVPGGSSWSGGIDQLYERYATDLVRHRISPILGVDPGDPGFAAAMKRYQEAGLGGFGVGRRGGTADNDWPAAPDELATVAAWYGTAERRLAELGLLDQAYVYAYDEPAPGIRPVADVLAALKRSAPGLRRLVVLHRPPDPVEQADWLRDADILVLHLAWFDPALADLYRRQGKELWTYVSTPAPPVPALVIDVPATEPRVLPWICWKLGLKGLLYWSVDYWRRNPWQDPRSFAGQNGNGVLYYPGPDGPVPSLRLELLRDGIEDHDYLALLRASIDAATRRGGVSAEVLAAAERLVAIDPELVRSEREYSDDPERLLATREAIADMIERLRAAPVATPAAGARREPVTGANTAPPPGTRGR